MNGQCWAIIENGEIVSVHTFYFTAFLKTLFVHSPYFRYIIRL